MKKILAIDDQQDNLTTLKAVIKNQIDDCLVLTAMTGKIGIEIARKEQPDTILLDIIMPQMDGYEVCEKLKADELTKHIPIIMVTAIKTDIASRVKGFNLGADAFLSKPIDPIELISQIKVMFRIKDAEDQLRTDKNLLEEQVRERTKKLMESEELFRLIAENTSDNIGITTFDLKAKYIYVSPSIKSVLDYEVEDLIGKSFFDFIHPDDKKRLLPLLVEYVGSKAKKLFNGKHLPTSRTIEYRFKNKAGEWRFLQSALNIVGDKILSVSRDITDQKAFESKLKSNERMLRDIIDTSPNLIFVKDRNGKYLVVNKGMADYHRTTPEKLIGTYDYQLAKDYFKTNDYNELRKTEQHVIDTKKPYHLTEDHFINDFGDERWFQTVMLPFDNADNQNCIMIIATDITEFVRIREALKESDRRFQELVELLPEAVIETDQNLIITYANKRAHELSGLSEKDFEKGVNGIDLLIPVDRERAKEYFIGRVKGLNPPKTLQYQALKKDGSKFHIHFHADSIIKDGVFKGIRAIIVDVSGQKKIEQTLIESEERYRSLMENLPVGVFRSTYEGKVISANPAMAAIYGYDSVEELLKVEAKDYYDESNPRELMLSELKEKGFLLGRETLENKKDGSLIWVSANYRATFNAKGEWLFIDGVIIDITERKKTENDLRKSEQDFRGLFENSHDAIIIFAPEGEIVLDVNERACKLYGISRDEFIGMSLKKVSQDIAVGEKNVQRTLKEGFFNQFETIQYKKDGSPLYLEINASMVEFGGQKAILSNNRDITERKLAEEAYHESAEKYRHLYDTSNDAIFLMKDYIFASCNPRTLEMFECSEEDILGHPPGDFSPEYQPDGKRSTIKAQEKIDAVIAGIPQYFEWTHLKKNGKPFVVEVSLNKMTLKNGEYIHAILRDITDRKRSEQTQKVILEISKFSHENLDLKSFLEKVHNQVNSILDARNFYVALYRKIDDTFTFPYYKDETEIFESDEPEKLKGSLTDYVRKTGKGHLITYEEQYKMRNTEPFEIIGHPSKVWLGAPQKK
jgi:PAS domain S-box-containing protein